jgi:hypothetical protein
MKYNKKIKKYCSAYMLYSKKEYYNIKKKYSNLNNNEIFKLIGQNWKKLPMKNKEKYFEEEKLEKEKFNKNKIKYEYSYNKNKKLLKKPKRFRTAFMFYLQLNKNIINFQNSNKIIKELSKKWNNMNLKDKEIYIKKELDDKMRYKKEYLEYINNLLKNEKKNKKNDLIKMYTKLKNIFNIDNNNNNNQLLLNVKNKILNKYPDFKFK